MRVVINERVVNRNRKIAQYAFFITLGILVLGLFVTNAAPTNALLALAPLVVLPIALGATLYSVRMANLWLREPRPDAALRDGLKGLSSRSVIYHYYLPAHHVLIAPQGVFTFTVRPQEGQFTVNGTKWHKAGGPFAKFMTFFRQDGIGKPHRDAERDAEAVQAFLDRVLPDSGVHVQPVIAFISPYAELEVIDSPIPVVHADSKKRPSLKQFLREIKKQEDTATLNAEQIRLLEEAAGIPEAA